MNKAGFIPSVCRESNKHNNCTATDEQCIKIKIMGTIIVLGLTAFVCLFLIIVLFARRKQTRSKKPGRSGHYVDTPEGKSYYE